MSSYLTTSNAASTYLALAGGTLTGNLAFSGSGLKITGDFSNGTPASRTYFQTSTANGQTLVTAVPNGTGANSQFQAYNSSDPNNSSIAALVASASQVRIVSGNIGTGTLNPITFIFSNTEAARFDPTTRNFLIGSSTDNTVDKLQVTGSASITSTLTAAGFIGRQQPRVVTITDATSITINSDTTDIALQTNTQVAGTLTINAPTGTPVDGQKIMLRLRATNAQTFSFNAAFTGGTDLSLPTTSSSGSKYDYLGFVYNSAATKWQLIAKAFGY
jgi:hypothetical protein